MDGLAENSPHWAGGVRGARPVEAYEYNWRAAHHQEAGPDSRRGFGSCFPGGAAALSREICTLIREKFIEVLCRHIPEVMRRDFMADVAEFGTDLGEFIVYQKTGY